MAVGVRTREPERRAQSWGRLQMIGIRTTTNVNTESQAETVLSGGTPLPNTILPTWNNNLKGHTTAAHQSSESEGCEVNHFSVMTHFLREN